MPETIRDVTKKDIPLWVRMFGGRAVIKNPHSNAGQGVYIITCKNSLDRFMSEEYPYNQFIVQSLIGHYKWSSTSEFGTFFHIGTLPDKRGDIFISDLRMIVCSSPSGFFPCAAYARRAKTALIETPPEANAWEMLGTNLSMKIAENQWESDSSRLMLMDRKDFNTLGLGIDDLIKAYVQTILTVVAIDEMAQRLVNEKGEFKQALFNSLNDDESLINEILV